MEFLTSNLSIILVSLVIGLLVGVALSKILNRGPNASELQDQLDEANAQLATYQQEVGEHFQKTAELVNNLTESYQDVHKHLSKGAQSLAQSGGLTLESSSFTALSDSSNDNIQDNNSDNSNSELDANEADPEVFPEDKEDELSENLSKASSNANHEIPKDPESDKNNQAIHEGLDELKDELESSKA